MISSKSNYAILAMIDISQHSNELVKIKDISKRQDISQKYLEQVIALLVKSKLLKSYRGNNGGYSLTKRVEEYSAYEIIFSVDNDILTDFKDSGLKKFWDNYNEATINYLKDKKLSDLIDDYNEYNGIYNYYI